MVKRKAPPAKRHVSAIFDQAFYERLQKVAKDMDRSVSYIVRTAIISYVEQSEVPKK